MIFIYAQSIFVLGFIVWPPRLKIEKDLNLLVESLFLTVGVSVDLLRQCVVSFTPTKKSHNTNKEE